MKTVPVQRLDERASRITGPPRRWDIGDVDNPNRAGTFRPALGLNGRVCFAPRGFSTIAKRHTHTAGAISSGRAGVSRCAARRMEGLRRVERLRSAGPSRNGTARTAGNNQSSAKSSANGRRGQPILGNTPHRRIGPGPRKCIRYRRPSEGYDPIGRTSRPVGRQNRSPEPPWRRRWTFETSHRNLTVIRLPASIRKPDLLG
jgi:hypothetical protein